MKNLQQGSKWASLCVLSFFLMTNSAYAAKTQLATCPPFLTKTCEAMSGSQDQCDDTWVYVSEETNDNGVNMLTLYQCAYRIDTKTCVQTGVKTTCPENSSAPASQKKSLKKKDKRKLSR